MIGTGVFTAVGRRRTGPALGWAVLLTLLMGAGVSAAEVQNPSFELTNGTQLRPLPRYWFPHDEPSCFNSYCSKLWKTEGTWCVGLFSLMKKPVTAGKHQSFFQESVDLTGIATIKFDVRLVALPDQTKPFAHFEASFLVDDVPLWKQTVGGTVGGEYRDQEVNVAGLGSSRIIDGYELYGHKIEMRITALDSNDVGFDLAYWTQWDNIRLIEGPKVVQAEIDLEPDTLYVHGPGKWVACFIELPAGYDVNDIDEATVTLQGIPAYLGTDGPWPQACHKSRIVDRDGDGLPERLFRFDHDALLAIVPPPGAILAVKGSLADKTPFEGAAPIEVVDKLAELKAKLEELKAKIQEARDQRKDGTKGYEDLKDLRDKLEDAIRKYHHNDKDDKDDKDHKDKDDRGDRDRGDRGHKDRDDRGGR